MYYEFEVSNLFVILGVIAICKWLGDKMNAMKFSWAQVDLTIATLLFAILLFLHTEVVSFRTHTVGSFSFDWVFLNVQLILFIYMTVTVNSKIGMVFAVSTVLLFYWERGFFDHWYGWLTCLAVAGGAVLMCAHGEQLLHHFWWVYLAALALSCLVWLTTSLTITNDSFSDWAINFVMFNIQFVVVNAFNFRLRRDYTREMMLTRQVNHDELTGLRNFRAFSNDLNGYYDAFQESQRAFSLITMDIDHFKHINDTYGHLVGNDVLAQTARTLKQMMKSVGGRAYRTGGEEFSLLMPLHDHDDAWVKAFCQRIQTAIREQTMVVDGQRLTWTMSIGCDLVSLEDSGYLEIYRRADKDLYHSKESGRNVITIQGKLQKMVN